MTRLPCLIAALLALTSSATAQNYTANVRVLVQFETPRSVQALCSTINSGRMGRVDACATSNLIIISNPCLYRRDSYADLLCHELRHVNGWDHRGAV